MRDRAALAARARHNANGSGKSTLFDALSFLKEAFILLHNPQPHPLLAVEEPENQLYPALLIELVEEFRDYAGRGGQVFVSTHSPDFLNGAKLEEILEEPSMRALLDGLLPRLYPSLRFLCVPHEGRADLARHLSLERNRSSSFHAFMNGVDAARAEMTKERMQ